MRVGRSGARSFTEAEGQGCRFVACDKAAGSVGSRMERYDRNQWGGAQAV